LEVSVATLQNTLAVSQNVKHEVAVWPVHCTDRWIPKRNDNMCSQKLVHDIHSSSYRMAT
jgi:hypothetical protein